MGSRGSTERDYKAEMLIESITAGEPVCVSILFSRSMRVCFDDNANVTGFVGPLAEHASAVLQNGSARAVFPLSVTGQSAPRPTSLKEYVVGTDMWSYSEWQDNLRRITMSIRGGLSPAAVAVVSAALRALTPDCKTLKRTIEHYTIDETCHHCESAAGLRQDP